MTEPQNQLYLKLIETLLNSPRELEMEILNAHRDLVNQALISNLIQVGESLRKKQYLDQAERLISLASRLLQLEKTNSETVNRQAYFKFLMTILQKVSQPHTPQLIYAILEQNIDKIDNNLAVIIKYWATETFASIEPQKARSIANDLVNFSNYLSNFSKGNRANNLEIAIVGYQTALQVYKKIDFPENWAIINSNLANAYRDRIQGNKTDNIEQAIIIYHFALTILTQEKYPYKWANIQRNLGIAYLYRFKDNRADNIDSAIAHYQQALLIHNFDDFPQDWAANHNNLGDAYLNRLNGNRQENLVIAIHHLQEALKIYNVQDFPHQWAMVQNNLGNAFQSKTTGEESNSQTHTQEEHSLWSRSQNIEKAIDCYHKALSVHTLNQFPYHWAMIQNNLAGAYRHRLKGDKSENIEQAIFFLRQASVVYTQDKFPQQWADIQQNLNQICSEKNQ